MFTFDEFWDNLCTNIFENSGSAANNIRSRLPSRLSSVSYDYGLLEYIDKYRFF